MSSNQLAEVLDNSAVNKRHYYYWLLSSGGTFLDGLSIFFLGVAFPLINQPFQLSTLMTGLIGAALVVAAGLGAAVGGGMADKLGRKTMMLLDMLIMAIGGMICVFSNSAEMILLGQLVIGFGIGIDFPVSSSYVSEIIPKKQRSRLLVGVITFQSIGLVIGAICSVIVLSLFAEPGWRYLFLMGSVWALLYFILRLSLPESPAWLVHKNQSQKAMENLHILYPTMALTEVDLTEDINSKYDTKSTPIAQNKTVDNLSALFSKRYIRKTILCSIPWFLMDIATYGIGLFTPVILVLIMTQTPGESILLKDISSAKGSGFIDLFLLVGFLLGLYVVPKFGKIRLQIIGFIGMALGMLILAYATGKNGNSPDIILVFIGFIIFNLLMNMGPNSTTFSLATDLFPTHIRALASGFAASVAKLGATFGIFFLPTIQVKFGTPFILVMMAVISLLGAIITFLLREKDI